MKNMKIYIKLEACQHGSIKIFQICLYVGCVLQQINDRYRFHLARAASPAPDEQDD